MNKLKSSQKDKVRQFMIFTQSNEKTALTCLSQNDWKLDVATDKFFQNPELYVPNLKGVLDKKKLEQLYNRYRDPHDDNKIGIDGIQQFCDDLTLDPASISVLLIAWKFRAATQCEFSKQEFMDGMAEQGQLERSHHLGRHGSLMCSGSTQKQWKSLTKEEQAKYYEQAQNLKEIHVQQHPEWSNKNNYGTKKQRIRGKRNVPKAEESASRPETQTDEVPSCSWMH
ncbi:DCN1-like protein 1 [Larimichthys crocea]|uniref:Uncharacterized protein n=1 Tax=Larimichthys crocea TaxID=215358 RepID=A0ACD3QSR1_LARCR|nr:DCN1-like protein 1 [Larimichthys crocea]